MKNPQSRERVVLRLWGFVLILSTLAVYWPVVHHDFIYFDDNIYVFTNKKVLSGLTREGITWAFTTTNAGFWHPLTWLSLMIDAHLYGLNPQGYHITNILLHLASTLLLYAALYRMTGAVWRSGFVAALFSLHPLHVEPAAWIAARKDVLCAVFWMLTMWAYVAYVQRSSISRYCLVLLVFGLGLMAKPMLVTLPFTLLLLDYWPLHRLDDLKWDADFVRTLCEKVPLLIMAALAGMASFIAEQNFGSLVGLDTLPFDGRVANGLVAYAAYLGKTIWPVDMAIFYPHPGFWPFGQVVSSGLILMVISVMILRYAKRFPYLGVGWLWYLGTLVPVSGLVQVGTHAMADRYTYIPLIGIFLALVWLIGDLLEERKVPPVLKGVLSGVIILFLAWAAHEQIHYWKDTQTLFRHALEVTKDNHMAHLALSGSDAREGQADSSVRHYKKAVAANPGSVAMIHNRSGCFFANEGNLEEAENLFQEALKISPGYTRALNNLGVIRAKQGDLDGAVFYLSRALQIKPDYKEARDSLQNVLKQKAGAFRE